MTDVVLAGCKGEPLIHYLKSLGVLRLVAEQKDSSARGYWKNNTFVLCSNLDIDDLQDFFLKTYQPTPIITPWNSRSGFWGHKTATAALNNILYSTNPRLSQYRCVIKMVQNIISQTSFDLRKDKNLKSDFIIILRSSLPDQVVPWIDAVGVMEQERVVFAPILGSGGNDGNMDFSSNHMQRLADIIPLTAVDSEKRYLDLSREWLSASLFNKGTPPLISAAVGQFHPGGVGGPNATQGFEGNSLVNPWDYVLMIEGSLLLAGSMARRTGKGTFGKASFPFTVYPSPAGWQTMSNNDAKSMRREIWLPLWKRPACLPEVAHLFAEGRAEVGKRTAITGSDLARAVASLGVERGINSFSRYGFVKRKGDGYISANLGMVDVHYRDHAHLLTEVDPWLVRFRRLARDDNTPTSYVTAQRQIDEAIFRYCQSGMKRDLQEILIAISKANLLIARSGRTQDKLGPISYLSQEWIEACDDGSPEHRLARSVGTIHMFRDKNGKMLFPPIRFYLEPVNLDKKRYVWDSSSTRYVRENDPVRALVMILQRRLLDAQGYTVEFDSTDAKIPCFPLAASFEADLSDINDFINGSVDNRLLFDLFRGFALVRPGKTDQNKFSNKTIPPDISRIYAICKLLFHHQPLLKTTVTGIPLNVKADTVVIRRLLAGDIDSSIKTAVGKLRAKGLNPLGTMGRRGGSHLPKFTCPAGVGPRIAAALLFPISSYAISYLMGLVMRLEQKN
jgi:CRISPR-associated protein Csx17